MTGQEKGDLLIQVIA